MASSKTTYASASTSGIKDAATKRTLDAINKNIQILAGQTGDGMDKAVTYRDINNGKLSDIIVKTAGTTIGGGSSSGSPGGSPGDIDAPHAPVNVQAFAAIYSVSISWNAPTYSGHAYARVLRAQSNDLSEAVVIGTTSANRYTDVASPDTAYWYWVRFVNQNEEQGAPNATAGTYAKTALSPDEALKQETNWLKSSNLAAALASRINLIDTTEVLAGYTGLTGAFSRVNVVQGQQATSISTLQTSVGGHTSQIASLQTASANLTERVDQVALSSKAATQALLGKWAGSFSAPVSTNYAGSWRANFSVDSSLNGQAGILRVLLHDAEGGAAVAFRGAVVGSGLTGPDATDVWFEFAVTLVTGTNEVAVWGATSGAFLIKRVELRGGEFVDAVAAVETRSTVMENAIGQLQARYAVGVQAFSDGKLAIASIGLLANGGTGQSEIIMLADKFALASPNYNSDQTLFQPFVYDATNSRMLVQNALIGNLTAQNFVGGIVIADALSVNQYVNLPASSISSDMLDDAFVSSLVRVNPNAIETGGSWRLLGTVSNATLTKTGHPKGTNSVTMRYYAAKWVGARTFYVTGTNLTNLRRTITLTVTKNGAALTNGYDGLASTRTYYTRFVNDAGVTRSGTLASEYPGDAGRYLTEILDPIDFPVQDDSAVAGAVTYAAAVTVKNASGGAVSLSSAPASTFSGDEAVGASGGVYVSTSWADILNKPATATRWPTWAEVSSKPSVALTDSMGIVVPAGYGGGIGATVKNQLEGGAAYTTWVTSRPASNAWHLGIGVREGTGPVYWDGSTRQAIYHTGSPPTPAEIGALPIAGGNLTGPLIAVRVAAGYDAGVNDSMSCSNWFRSSGVSGWYNATYGGGLYMTDTTWVRTYNGKKFYCDNAGADAIHTAGGFKTSLGVFDTGAVDAQIRRNGTTMLTLYSGYAQFAQQCKAPSFYPTSSIRYKNISRVDDGAEALRRVLALGANGVSVGSFKGGEKLHRWLIAEDVAKVSPEVIDFDAEGRVDGMSYDELVPDLIVALAYVVDRMRAAGVVLA